MKDARRADEYGLDDHTWAYAPVRLDDETWAVSELYPETGTGGVMWVDRGCRIYADSPEGLLEQLRLAINDIERCIKNGVYVDDRKVKP